MGLVAFAAGLGVSSIYSTRVRRRGEAWQLAARRALPLARISEVAMQLHEENQEPHLDEASERGTSESAHAGVAFAAAAAAALEIDARGGKRESE